MNTGAFGEGFPYSNFHDLNMDWIIKIAKDFLDQYTHIQEIIANGEEDIEALTTESLAQLTETKNNLEAQLNQWYNTHQHYLDQYVVDSIQQFNSAADLKTAQSIASIPDDYTTLANSVTNLISALTRTNFYTATTDEIDFSDYSGNLVSGYWRTTRLYQGGYIKSVKGKLNGDTAQTVIILFLLPATNEVTNIFIFSGVNPGTFELTINTVIDHSFNMAIYCINLGIKSGTSPVYRTTALSAPVGTDLTGTNSGNYDLAFYPVYKELARRFYESVAEASSFDIILDTNDLAMFTGKLNTGWWWNDYAYEAGYIDHITLQGTEDGIGNTCGIMIIDSTTNKVLFAVDNYIQSSTLKTVIPVHMYSSRPVYIAYKGYNLGYISTGPNRNFKRDTVTTLPAPGEQLSYTWDGSANYKFGIKVTYKAIPQMATKYCKTRKRMFICGDSITAGHPYTNNPYIPGIKYGDAIGRTLGYDVTYGAQSGNGWLYSTGSANAYSITNSTDFKQFDVAFYAWGTNDFFHDMPLGDINDTYSDQTVCGTINYCINKIYTDNPSIVLVICTPLNRTYENSYGYNTPNNAGYTLLDMVNKMVELCRAHGIAYIDNTCSPFNPLALPGLTDDGLHPNRVGYQVLGAYLSSKMSNIITPYVSVTSGD